jgi:hypothetical protein
MSTTTDSRKARKERKAMLKKPDERFTRHTQAYNGDNQ